ncbi:hypothetical protein [Dactylosporangium sp. CA-092794]|uniref:hypothetical protein n=1 Tax=Dactylosporangium sp. CA-092794 TaxID=3239929 RepID=UPI003D9504BC
MTDAVPHIQPAAGPWPPPTAFPAVVVPFDRPYPARFPVASRVPAPLVPPPLRPAAAPPPPGRPATRRFVLTAMIAVTVVLVLIAAVLARAASGPGPRDVVIAFFDALTAHDTSGFPSGQCLNNPLCGPGALHTGYQAPQDVTVGDDTGAGDDRHVPVAYTLDGHRATSVVDVHATHTGSLTGPIWAITSPPPGAQLAAPAQTPAPISIAAARLSAPTGTDPPRAFWAPPGQYTITRPGTSLLEPATTSVTITTASAPIPITIPATIQPAAATTINELIHDRIDSCAAQHSFTPAVGPPPTVHSCPVVYYSPYAFTDKPTWTVDAYPHLQLEPADDGSITVTTSTPGTASVHYRWTTGIIEPRTWTDAADHTDITITGRVVAPNGTIAWQPR